MLELLRLVQRCVEHETRGAVASCSGVISAACEAIEWPLRTLQGARHLASSLHYSDLPVSRELYTIAVRACIHSEIGGWQLA